jgi:hypothetical protein
MKTSMSFRFSDQALNNLETICRISGVNQTAVVEIALAALASGLTKESKMNAIKITLSEQDLFDFLSADLKTNDDGNLSEYDVDLVNTRCQQYADALAVEMRKTYSTFDNTRVTVEVDRNALEDGVRVDGTLDSDEVQTEFDNAKAKLANRLDEIIPD